MSAVLLLLLVTAPPPTVAFAPASPPTWFQLRAQAVMADQLRSVGFTVRPAGALTPPRPDDVVLTLRSQPAAVDRGTTSVVLSVAGEGVRPAVARVKGPAVDMERLVAGLTAGVCRSLGRADVDGARLAPTPLPFVVHRRLGRAAVRLRSGKARQAMLAFDQAGRQARVGPLPDAIEGRRRALLALVQDNDARWGERSALAASCVERAEVAARRGDREAERQAWEGFLRYTDAFAERWRVPARLPVTAKLYPARQAHRLAADGRVWRIDAKTGGAADPVPMASGLVEILGEETLHLVDRVLSRRTATGAVRWRLALPVAPAGADGVLSTSGLVGILGVDTVVWVDSGLGRLGQVSRRTPPLAASAGGVLVQLPPRKGAPQIGLLRPGKQTPAWRVALPDVSQAMLTRERVAVVSRGRLHLLRTHNGKPARRPSAWPEGARWLHVDGRYGTAVVDERTVIVLDVLTGRETGRRRGPGRPIAALTQTEGVAVLFASGDVLQLDREAQVVDRARVPGRPLRLVPGHPLAPGAVVLTSEGVFALAEARRGVVRDVDAYLALARVLQRAGRDKAALRLATAVAVRSVGRVAAAEDLRAQLLRAAGDEAGASRASARAEVARDSARPLVPPGMAER